MQKQKIYLIAAVIVIALFAVFFALPSKEVEPQKLAACLTEKGWTMYGTSWCSHCQNTKAAFGEAFKKVSFVDCDFDTFKCSAAGVSGYPTWFNGKQSIVGEKTLEELASLTGCNQ